MDFQIEQLKLNIDPMKTWALDEEQRLRAAYKAAADEITKGTGLLEVPVKYQQRCLRRAAEIYFKAKPTKEPKPTAMQ